MAKAEFTAVDKMLRVELCSNIDCTCRVTSPEPTFLRIGKPDVGGDGGISTNLCLSADYGIEGQVPIRGVLSPFEVASAFDECEGPIEISSGEVVCGAVARLRKQV